LFGVWQSTVELINALHAARPTNDPHYQSLVSLPPTTAHYTPSHGPSQTQSHITPLQSCSPTHSTLRPELLVSAASPSSAPSSPPTSPRTSFALAGAGLFRRATRRPAPSVRTKSANDAPTPAPGLLPGGLGRVAAKSWDPVVSGPGGALVGSVGMDLVVGSSIGSTSVLAGTPMGAARAAGPRKLRKAVPGGKGALRVRTDETTLAVAAGAGDKGKQVSASPDVMTAYTKYGPSLNRSRSPLSNEGRVEFTPGHHPCHTRESHSSGDSYNADSENVRPTIKRSASSRSNKDSRRSSSQPGSPGSSSGWAGLFKRQPTLSTPPSRLPRSGSSSTSLSSWDLADDLEPTVSGAPSAKAASNKSSFEVVYRGPEAKVTHRKPSNPLLKSSTSEHSLAPSTASLASVMTSGSGANRVDREGLPRRRTGSSDLLAVGASTDELGQIDEQPEPLSPPNVQSRPTVSATSSATMVHPILVGLTESNTPTPIPSPRSKRNATLAPEPTQVAHVEADLGRWHASPPPAFLEADDSFARTRSHSMTDSVGYSVGDSSWRCSEGEAEDTPASSADAGDDDDDDEVETECRC